LANSEIGKHFAVDRDAGFGEAGNEAAVVQAERTHRGVEALDPKRTEGALAPLAVAIGILICLLYRLFGDANRVLTAPIITLCGLKHLLVLGMGGDAALDASHGRSPFTKKSAWPILPACAAGRAGNQLFGRKYFLILSPSVLNSTLVPRNW